MIFNLFFILFISIHSLTFSYTFYLVLLASFYLKLSLFTLSNTPEGKKLLEDLNTTSSKLKLSFSNQLDETDYGSANLKKEGFPVELNSNLTKDHSKLTTTLFHELCHVRQYQQGVGTLGDLPEEKCGRVWAGR